jgi:hypothetical protein
VLNRTCLPRDFIAFVVFCRLRYRLTVRDLSEILLLRGIEVSHETIRDWETQAAAGHGRGVAQAPTRNAARIGRQLVCRRGVSRNAKTEFCTRSDGCVLDWWRQGPLVPPHGERQR